MRIWWLLKNYFLTRGIKSILVKFAGINKAKFSKTWFACFLALFKYKILLYFIIYSSLASLLFYFLNSSFAVVTPYSVKEGPITFIYLIIKSTATYMRSSTNSSTFSFAIVSCNFGFIRCQRSTAYVSME